MLPPGTRLHRLGLAGALLGNVLLFAGVDPPTRAATALLVLVLVLDLRRPPALPGSHRFALAGLAALVVVQLLPLPHPLRALLAPGLADLVHPGWAPLSVAPWSTLETAAGLAVAFGIAVTAARMASTRSGLPTLLGILAAAAALLAVLGLASEGGAPERVLLVRPNTGGGGAYGPFVNSNHFALALELTLPAALVLLAVSGRHLARKGDSRREGSVLGLAALGTLSAGVAALLRSGSRGGVLFLAVAAVATAPLWLKPRRATRWPWLVAAALLVVGALTLAWTRLPALREDFKQLLAVEGVEGNSRVDLWSATWRLAARAPVAGVGLGAYRHAIGLDKPATDAAVLEQAHNDWLEWLATTGAAGAAVLALGLFGLALLLRPGRVRWLRFEYRYPTAGAALALVAVALHELVDFGLQIPLNRYLLACWIGLLWGGVASGGGENHGARRRRVPAEAGEAPAGEGPAPQGGEGERET